MATLSSQAQVHAELNVNSLDGDLLRAAYTGKDDGLFLQNLFFFPLCRAAFSDNTRLPSSFNVLTLLQHLKPDTKYPSSTPFPPDPPIHLIRRPM